MRIGIDARFFGPVGKGLGRYTERLIENLEQVAGDHEFVIFLRKENFDLFQPKSPRFSKVLANFGWYSFAEQFRFPPLVRRQKIDLMHFPHFNVPILVPCPFVVTIHDLILLRYPTKRATTRSRLFYTIKYAAYKFVIQRAVQRARRVITVSEYTKSDILKHLHVPNKKIEVAYEASDLLGQGSAESTALDLTTHGIDKPYFLYVGNAYPHKNLERLIRVFGKLRTEGLEAQLVLVGKKDYFYERLHREAGDLGLIDKGDVIFFGFAKDHELIELYRQARAYVFPSLLEGFGLPPLEAMSQGTPVAAAGSSCLPEILGSAAVYFDPENENDMARVMNDIYHNENLREDLAEKGLRRTNDFSWKDCAKKTYDIYTQVLRS